MNNYEKAPPTGLCLTPWIRRKKIRPAADAKEVEVRNPAEETCCHRTGKFFAQATRRRPPSFAVYLPFFAIAVDSASPPGDHASFSRNSMPGFRKAMRRVL